MPDLTQTKNQSFIFSWPVIPLPRPLFGGENLYPKFSSRIGNPQRIQDSKFGIQDSFAFFLVKGSWDPFTLPSLGAVPVGPPVININPMTRGKLFRLALAYPEGSGGAEKVSVVEIKIKCRKTTAKNSFLNTQY